MPVLMEYARERLRPGRLFPPTLLVAIAAQVVRGWRGPLPALADAGLALALVSAFRLWDDLADRERDARSHPDRVMVRAASPAPFVAALLAHAALTATWIVWRDGVGAALVTFVMVVMTMATWYTQRGQTPLGALVLLAKYPAFVVVIAGGPSAVRSIGGGLALATVYAIACGYEAWHDRAAPAAVPSERASEAQRAGVGPRA